MAFFEHKIIQGERAGKWLPFARTKVAALHARARAMGVTALVQRWAVESGDVEVAVRVVGDQRYIHIRRTSCPVPLSGFLDAVGGEGSFFGVFTVPNPTPPPDTIEVFRRFFPSPAQIDPPRAFRDESQLVLSGPQTPFVKGSMYSGEMRKVVQVLQGFNVEIIDGDTGALVYSPLVSPTHGVYKVATGQRWIIKISNTGVVAWPMQMCRNPVLAADGKEALDYTPILTPEPTGPALAEAILAGTYRTLLDADGVRDFYTKIPFFPTCGWAFSQDGHEAANVCWENSTPVHTSLYKIRITENDSGPVSATLSLVKDGNLAVASVDASIRYPAGFGSRNVLTFTLPPVPGYSTDAPVYCYYDGNTLVAIRLVNNKGVNDLGQDERVPCGSTCGTGLLAAPNEDGVPYSVGGAITTSEVPHFEGVPNPSVVSQTNITSTTFRSIHLVGPIGVDNIVVSCPSGGTYIEVWQYSRSEFTLNGAELARNTLLVPAYDREAVYIGGRLDGTGMMRTNYSASSYVRAAVGITIANCTFGNILFRATADGCCSTSPSQPLQVGTTGEPTNATLCENGTHFTEGLLGPPDGFVQTFIPYNSQITVGKENGGTCIEPTLPETQQSTASFLSEANPIVIGVLERRLAYIASDGARADLALPPVDISAVDIFNPELTNFPLISIRDAFDGRKFIISPRPGAHLGSDCLSSAVDYPVNEAAAGMAFIGVP